LVPVFFEWTNRLPADFETGEYGVYSNPGIRLRIMDLHSQEKSRLQMRRLGNSSGESIYLNLLGDLLSHSTMMGLATNTEE
jgi:hypothetical protein